MLVGGVGPGPLVYRQRIGVVSVRMKVVLGVSVNQNLSMAGGVCGSLVYSLRLTKIGISLCKNESSIRCVCVRIGVVCVRMSVAIVFVSFSNCQWVGVGPG